MMCDINPNHLNNINYNCYHPSIIPKELHSKVSHPWVGLKLLNWTLHWVLDWALHWCPGQSWSWGLSALLRWISAAHAPADWTWSRLLVTGGFSSFHAFPPVISSIEVEAVVVRGRRRLGVVLWEKTRAHSHGATKPAWWHTQKCYLMRKRMWDTNIRTEFSISNLANNWHRNEWPHLLGVLALAAVWWCHLSWSWADFCRLSRNSSGQPHGPSPGEHRWWVCTKSDGSLTQVWCHMPKKCYKDQKETWWN